MFKLILILLLFGFSTYAYASSVTGDYNDFSVSGLSSGDYWEAWVFDSGGDSLADATCGLYGSSGNKSNFTVEDVGFGGDTLGAGDYTLFIGAGGGCGGGWEHNPDCGIGKTLTNCCTAYGGCPANYTYGVSYEFTVSAGSSTPSTTTSTAMTSFEKFLSYEIILIIVLLSGIGTYKLLT